MWNREDFRQRFTPPLIGMIHLPALPGAPAWNGSLAEVKTAALADAGALVQAGLTAALVENYHDAPFHPRCVPPETVAALTVVCCELRREFPLLSLGVNVPRNDAEAALAVACAVGAEFMRVNVHCGAMVTDQGIIEGRAWHTLRRRRELGADVGILADVRVKHAQPLAPGSLAQDATDLRLRGMADAIIVTGEATGKPAERATLAVVRQALPDAPLLVGSGVAPGSVAEFVDLADGFIVGSSLQEWDPVAARAAISPTRTLAMVHALPGRVAKG
jgi:membrane complex biogenesis BtpA family protein